MEALGHRPLVPGPNNCALLLPNYPTRFHNSLVSGNRQYRCLIARIELIGPQIKRLKIGDTEIELKEEIAKLGSEVEKAQVSESRKPARTKSQKQRNKKSSANTQEIIEKALANPRGTLLVISAAIEQELSWTLSI